jgi:hypothetical protein
MKKPVMKRLTFVCLGLFLITAVAPDAFAWRGGAGAVRGPNGGGAVRGPMGRTAVRGPNGGTAYRGGYHGGTAYRGGYYGGAAYRGGYYGGAVVRPGVAAGVAVGAAAGAARASDVSVLLLPAKLLEPPSKSRLLLVGRGPCDEALP